MKNWNALQNEWTEMITRSRQRAEITESIESIRDAAHSINYTARTHEHQRKLNWAAKAEAEYRREAGLWRSLLIFVRATIDSLPEGARAWVEAEAANADREYAACRAKLSELAALTDDDGSDDQRRDDRSVGW